MSKDAPAGLTDQEIESWKAKRHAAAQRLFAGGKQLAKAAGLTNRALRLSKSIPVLHEESFDGLCEESIGLDCKNMLVRINDAIALLQDSAREIKDADHAIQQAAYYQELEQAKAKIAEIESY